MPAHLTTGYPLKTGDTKTQLANLQQVVTSLIDELSHILYNLDAGNVLEAATVQKLKAGSVTAEAISQSYKTEVMDTIDGSAATLRQEFTAADGKLTSEIGLVKESGEKLSSRLEQTEKNISSVVTKKMSFEEATKREVVPTAGNTTDDEKERLYFCTGNNTYYYWNEISSKWMQAQSNSIYSAFIQTADGFEFNGELVKVSGNLIAGTLSGVVVKSEDKNGNIVSQSDGHLFLLPSGASSPKLKIGCNTYDATAYPYIQMGGGTNEASGNAAGHPATKGTVVLYKDAATFGLSLNPSDDSVNQGIWIYDYGWDGNNGAPCVTFGNSTVDFRYATVKGIETEARFG